MRWTPIAAGLAGAALAIATAAPDAGPRPASAQSAALPAGGQGGQHPFMPTDARGPALLGWPLAGVPQVLRPFEWQAPDWLPGHRGVDLAAPVTGAVVAPADGVVTFAGTVVNRGVVTVTHGDLRSSFEPVDPVAPVGTRVRRGEVVGYVAASPQHCAARTCLHWGVRRGADYLDPQALARERRVAVLLE